jgi:hypothetical protein
MEKVQKDDLAMKVCLLAGDDCPIPVRLDAWRDGNRHVDSPTERKCL